jgi:SAM-dependent methyltransferase
MPGELEDAVARHYQVSDLTRRILDGLAATGVDIEQLTPGDLAPVDEFHIGGRRATLHVIAKMGLSEANHVLDVGCGIGGAARTIASTVGARVTGIDLTEEFIEAARELTVRTGLGDRVAYHAGSALQIPFQDRTFDAAVTLHVAMNIKDRAGLYREVARVLKPGALFAVYDVMQGPNPGLQFPVPWASTPATSFLVTPDAMRTLLTEAGFSMVEVEDRTAAGAVFFRERLAAGSQPAVGLHVLTGSDTRIKSRNMLAGLEAGAIAPVIMIARRQA